MARQQQEKQAAVTTGSDKTSGIPCAMVLTLMSCSPWEPGCLAHAMRAASEAFDVAPSARKRPIKANQSA
jgi:hypothetical protein